MKTIGLTTKNSILNAAERLFAARGFRGTSLRAITAAAKANLGAVNYHFTSKDALILAVLRRRLRPLNERGLALLDQFKRAAGESPVPVEKILEAMFRPSLELIAKPAKDGHHFLRLMAITLDEPGAYLKPLLEEQFSEKTHRFHQAFQRALPELPGPVIHWRMHFSYGVLIHTIAHPHILELSSRGVCRLAAPEKTLAGIVAFCAAGFRTALPSPISNQKRHS